MREYRINPDDFRKVYVRSKSGANVPLSALITTRYVASPKLMTRFNGFPAVKVTGSQAPGYSSGQALNAMEEVAREVAAGRLRLLLGRTGAAGEGVGQHLLLRVHLRPDRGVPAARRPVREVDAADRGGADRALRGARRARAHLAAGAAERRVLPGRAGDAGGPGGQERDPDLRVRHRARAPRHAARARRPSRRRACACAPSS